MDWRDIPVTDGTGQRERMPRAFAPGYFDVDELTFEKLLAMGSEFAAQLEYYNLANKPDGNWGDLFYADEAVVMATILSTDLARVESEFRAIPYNRPRSLVKFLLGIAHRFDDWYRRLFASSHASGELMMKQIVTLIDDKLANELHKLAAVAEHVGMERDAALAGFADPWRLAAADSEDSYPRSIDETLPPVEEIKHYLSASFYVFANAIAYLQKNAEKNLLQSRHSQQHDPAVGLFMVFLQLFEQARDRLNRFTPRHLDFYYRQMLEAVNQPRSADSYYLLLTAQAGAGKRIIDKDTAFSAGQDADLNEIVYRADENLLLGDARVESLLTLHLQHDRLISPESNFDFITRIKAGRPAQDRDETQAGAAPAEQTAWPLFGAGAGTADARIGFCIASPLLMLQQGKRRIEISFMLEPIDLIGWRKRLKRLSESNNRKDFRRDFAAWFALYLLRFKGGVGEKKKNKLIESAKRWLQPDESAEIERLLQEDWQGLFYRLFKQPLKLHLTGADDWFEVCDPVVLPLNEDESSTGTGFRLLLELAPADPPVIGYRSELHGMRLDTELPVLRCVLNPEAHFCVYSVLQNLLVARLDIEVAVEGVRQLQVYNQNGQLDPGKPFQPFGPAPGAGSYFVFGNAEIAQKPLQRLKLHLEWADLPAGGFAEHYAGYAASLDNQSFEVEFSTLSDHRWVPEDPASRDCFKLFAPRADETGVEARQTITIETMDYARALDAAPGEADFRFDLKTRGGFFRLSLSSPQGGFGHDEYTPLLTSVLAANARKKKPDAVPNPPYTPLLSGITLDYRAQCSFDPALDHDRQTRLYHLHPFGVDRAYPTATGQTCHLLPQYRHEGNLFIGLDGSELGGPLSLLFHLAQDKVDPLNAGKAELEWFYLVGDRWQKMPENSILADSTHGFLTSGKVTLDIPADISIGSSIMPAQYYWLRVTADRAADAFSACYFVKPHALRVSRDMPASSGRDSVDAEARPNSWSLLQNQAGVDSVRQAFAAFGGRPAETDDDFKIRVSERLRHKNRALMPRDYEQLALERFPELEKVKCFNSLCWSDETVRPGQVLVAVVPRVDGNDHESCRRQRVDARKLDEIRTYLLERSPPFIGLEVINPTYEQIQVRCKARFTDALSEAVNLVRLNQQISDYLCPWTKPGYEARFGWKIRQRDIESYILGLGYIDLITDFSMLHITVDKNQKYRLFDSASDNPNHEAVIEPHYPWSLAIPMRQHYLETTREARSIEAQVTGVDELEIGATFIIGNGKHGEKE